MDKSTITIISSFMLGSLGIVISFADDNILSNAMANEEKTNHMKETTQIKKYHNIYLEKNNKY